MEEKPAKTASGSGKHCPGSLAQWGMPVVGAREGLSCQAGLRSIDGREVSIGTTGSCEVLFPNFSGRA